MRFAIALALVLLVASACGDDSPTRPLGDGGLDAPTGTTACPEGADLSCDAPTEICVITTPRGPAEVASCEPVPQGCEADRSCRCAGPTLCQSPYDSCSESADNTLTCSCLNCQ